MNLNYNPWKIKFSSSSSSLSSLFLSLSAMDGYFLFIFIKMWLYWERVYVREAFWNVHFAYGRIWPSRRDPVRLTGRSNPVTLTLFKILNGTCDARQNLARSHIHTNRPLRVATTAVPPPRAAVDISWVSTFLFEVTLKETRRSALNPRASLGLTTSPCKRPLKLLSLPAFSSLTARTSWAAFRPPWSLWTCCQSPHMPHWKRIALSGQTSSLHTLLLSACL